MMTTNSGRKILITGATGTVARPIAEALAAEHEVWALARFRNRDIEDQLRARGVRTWRWDMGRDALDGLPADFTHVLHAAWQHDVDIGFDDAIELDTVAVGRLMTHCRTARAFIYVSTGAVYARQQGDHLYGEQDPVGGLLTWMPEYTSVKSASEGVVRALTATLGLRTVIARLNVAYGPYGHGGEVVMLYREMLAGRPIAVPLEGQDLTSMIHTEDLVRQVPLLWEAASSRALILNWGGDETIGLQDCMEYVASITGTEACFVRHTVSRQTCAFDNTKRRLLIGNCSVHWKDGVRRVIEAHFPGAVKTVTNTRPA
jgi:nucleoside-diphosphate-sugar epimerase